VDVVASNDVPNVFCRMTKLAASDASAQAVIADTDRFVLDVVGKVILAFGHGTNEDTDAFIWCKALNVVLDSDNLCVEAQRDFPAIGRKMVGYRVLDNLEELFLRVCRSYGQFVEELDHEPCEALEGTRYPHCRADLNEDSFRGVNVDLKLASFVYRRVQESKQALQERIGQWQLIQEFWHLSRAYGLRT
jgi:hypothetical protein